MAPRSGEHERHLALSTLVQQGTYVITTVVMLGVITALGRTLSLSAFGVYGLIVSFGAYLMVAQGAVEAAAMQAIARALDDDARQRAFSMALFVYALAGLAIGAVIAGGGALLVGAFHIPPDLRAQARLGVVLLGLVTCVGWPLKTYQDLLRGSQMFAVSATAEAAAFVGFGVLMAVALVAGAPLWVLIAIGGCIPALTGLGCLLAARRSGVALAYRHRSWTREALADFLATSRGLFVTSLADLFIYALDRVVLGLFRPAATVGLYEGPVRAHNVVRQVQGVLALTVLPTGARYLADGDLVRVRELVVRGTRYTLFASLPIIVVFMVLARPILAVWLGPKFATAGTAMTLLVSYWLVAANTNVPGAMLVAAGRVREFARYAWAVAIANLVLSLALTPWLGLTGVVLGTTIPYFVSFPFFMGMVRRWLPVRIRQLAVEAWAPAYAVAGVTAAVLLVVRLTWNPDTIASVAACCALGVLGAWALTYAAVLRPSEKRLVADVAGHVGARVAGLLPARSVRDSGR